jgi:uncharacterized membrane protein YkoI
MRPVLALLMIAALLGAGPALAGPGNGNSDHTKQENNGNANGAGNGEANGADKGNGNGNGAVGGAADSVVDGAEAAVSGLGSTDGTADADQNGALDAVKSGQALPLSEIIALAQRAWGGRVIDAKLVQARGNLLYRLTMLDDGGVSRRVYYQARTGQAVGGR